MWIKGNQTLSDLSIAGNDFFEIKDNICYLKKPLNIGENATLFANSDSCSGIRMYPDTSIVITGSIFFKDIFVTSYDPITNDHVYLTRAEYDKTRPYIYTKFPVKMFSAINTEFSYLGYYRIGQIGSKWGVAFYDLPNGEVRNSSMHHNYFGLYSSNASHITVENSKIYSNLEYGLDFHTYSNNFLIYRNEVYDNGNHAIIFSQWCNYNQIIENNVRDNIENVFVKGTELNYGTHGIMLDYSSNYNLVQGNRLENNRAGIYLTNSKNNVVRYNQVITDLEEGIRLKNSSNNLFENNSVFSSDGYSLYLYFSPNNTYNNNNFTNYVYIKDENISHLYLVNDVPYFYNYNSTNVNSTINDSINSSTSQPPITIATNPGNTWINADYYVTLNATGFNNTPIAYISYTLNNTRKQINGSYGNVLINSSKNNTLIFYAIDILGNVETLNTIYALLDKIKPNITSFTLSETNVTTGSEITGTCQASDNLDPNVVTNITGIDTSTIGTKKAMCTATDQAGNNKTAVVSYTVNFIYSQAPITISTNPGNTWINADYYVTLNATGFNNTPIAYISYTLNDAHRKINGNFVNVLINSSRNNTLTFYAVDILGNVETLNTIYALLDKIKPNITSFTLSATNVTLGNEIIGTCVATDNLFPNPITVITVIDTSITGTKKATCTATDQAGNTKTAVATYTVSFISLLDKIAPNITSFTLSPMSVTLGNEIIGKCDATDNFPNVTTVITGIDTTTAGTKNAKCTATDFVGNIKTAFATYTVNSTAPSSSGGNEISSGGSTRSSSGGGSSSRSTSGELQISQSSSFLEMTEGLHSIDFTKAGIAINNIEITTIGDAANVKTTVTQLTEKPSSVPTPQIEKLYGYLQIDHTNLNNSLIQSAKIRFKVSKVWIKNNNISVNQMILYRFTTEWNMINTSMISQDSLNYYFEANSPGLSYFAIGTAEVQTTIPTITPIKTVTPVKTTTSSTELQTTDSDSTRQNMVTIENTETIGPESNEITSNETSNNTNQITGQVINQNKNKFSWTIMILVLLVVVGLILGGYFYFRKEPKK
jgi:PGF-pre-PGF domain-containing protein